MSETRPPRTTWEHCISLADLLLQWHAQDDPTLATEPRRTRATVLLAAVLADRAGEAGLEGPAITALPLADVETGLQYTASALEACPAPPEAGGRERDDLLTHYGQPETEVLHHGVRRAVRAHREAAAKAAVLADRMPTLTERIPALQAAADRRRQVLADLFDSED